MKQLLVCTVIMIAQICWGGYVKQSTIDQTVRELEQIHGEQHTDRIRTGVKQVAQLWRESDGTPSDFEAFCTRSFITDPLELDRTFTRFQENLEIIYGHMHEINRGLCFPVECETQYLLPVDHKFAEYDPFAHVQSDLFANKIAFIVLLNFPAFSLSEKLELGPDWTREEWARARLADEFLIRLPSSVAQERSRIYVQADNYIANYNIHMHSLIDSNQQRLFPEGLKLITHWGLRDELKAQYNNPNGLQRQQMIQQVMQRIITQTIPQSVIDNPDLEWDPRSNILTRNGIPVEYDREPDTRYQTLLNIFHAEQKADPYTPAFPTKIDRRFKHDREMTEQQFEDMAVSVLTSPVANKVVNLICSRLGRPLQPFDIWYNGFQTRGGPRESKLDSIVSQRYPDVNSFQVDLVHILQSLDFPKADAEFLATKITVDPSRGAGHATGAKRRQDNAHLRTRISDKGMDYKGFNIAIHELGHNVEQVFSLNRMDHYLLEGVPNTAFTEAFAFVFQARDLDILGIKTATEQDAFYKALDTYWSTCEIAAVGLVDLRVWRWMYDHPDADAEQLKQAVINIARNVWNEYYAPLIGHADSILLAIYSHMIAYGLYLPDYSMGHLIMFQIEQYLKDNSLGKEMERMCRQGRLTPNFWMKQAVGETVSPEPLIKAAEYAVKQLH
mgnify:CR=1 FL=1